MRRVTTDCIPEHPAFRRIHSLQTGRLPLVACVALLLAVSAARSATAQETAAEAKAAPATAAAPLSERLIEKREGAYSFRLTLKPGDLQVGKVAVSTLEIYRVLDIPDPVTGLTRPVQGLEPVAEVNPPTAARRGAKAAESISAKLWPLADPGSYGFHFTPAVDGVYSLRVTAQDVAEGGGSRPFVVTFRIGVGSAAAETEQGSGSAVSRRGGRRPVGPGAGQRSAQQKLQRLMEQVGDDFLSLEAKVDALPARGVAPKAARTAIAEEAKALAALLAQASGSVPARHTSGAEDYEALLKAAVESLNGLAEAADGKKGAPSPQAAFESVKQTGCLSCHSTYRWDVTAAGDR